jgi:glyoxylase-like metal-dependent hydrolase (beta-lactamase superfamily II)
MDLIILIATNRSRSCTGDAEMTELKSLRIRMYRGILGDCFLLRTTVGEGATEVTRAILIDCGVLQNVADGEDLVTKLDAAVVKDVGKERLAAIVAGPKQISAIAKDVLQEVNGTIDLLVITHEHFDHLSGFAVEKAGFLGPDVKIGRLWLAWTEDRKDKQANDLRARFDQAKEALGAAVALAARLGADAPPSLQNAAALAAFSGPIGVRGLAASGQLSTAEIINMLKEKAGSAATSYLEPGQVIDLSDFGLKAYVLGPPRLESLLEKDSPSSGAAKEVYLTRLDSAIAAKSTLNARLALSDPTVGGVGDRDLVPFARVHHRSLNVNRKPHVKNPPASQASSIVRRLYEEPSMQWRAIDSDWTGSVEALALKMDSDTNNTSLALAFELPDGQVLLFPGDAQVGNWLSWNKQVYPVREGTDTSRASVTAEDLLSRVTFYKAGHHGSHNATLKAFGLERMTDTRLTAAIPVVEAVAAIQGKGRANVGKGWKMPYGPMYQDLEKFARGRIVRGDGNPEGEKLAFAANPTDPANPVTVAHGDLWVELTYTF